MNKFYNSRAFQFFAIIIISSLCLLLDQLTRINFNKIDLPKDRPEYNAKGVDGRVYSNAGKLQYKLLSNEAWEFPDNDRIYLRKFKIYMYNESNDNIKYELDADDGWFNNVNKTGNLGLNAVLTVESSEPNKIIHFYGSHINLDLNKDIFTSKENAHAIQGKSSIYSTGFSYDNNAKFLTLDSKVKVIYEHESGIL